MAWLYGPIALGALGLCTALRSTGAAATAGAAGSTAAGAAGSAVAAAAGSAAVGAALPGVAAAAASGLPVATGSGRSRSGGRRRRLERVLQEESSAWSGLRLGSRRPCVDGAYH